jgi:hypothetical protein
MVTWRRQQVPQNIGTYLPNYMMSHPYNCDIFSHWWPQMHIMSPLLFFPFPPLWSASATACLTRIKLDPTLTEITGIFWIACGSFIQNSKFVCYFKISVPAQPYQVSTRCRKFWWSSSDINALVTFTFESLIVLLPLNWFQVVFIIQSLLCLGYGNQPLYKYYHFFSCISYNYGYFSFV